MRILLYNVGYGTGLDGSVKNYLLRFYRYFYTPRWIIRQVRQSLYNLLNREHPDVCCFIEVHRKHGFIPHPHSYHFHADVKYGQKSILRRMPFFRDNCNAFCSRQPLKFEKKYFRNGTKKLIFDITLPGNLHLLVVHFSLRERTRRKQCKELQAMIADHSNVIICGDFNVFRGTRELKNLAESCGLRFINAHHATFPTACPRKTLDMFLCPASMESVTAKVFNDIRVSDHLPVMLEVGGMRD
jgi:exonuclease III